MLVLSDAEIQQILTPDRMGDLVAILEDSYKEWSEGRAMVVPRTRMRYRHAGHRFTYNAIPGVVEKLGVCALRVGAGSGFLDKVERPGRTHNAPHTENKICDLVLLWSTTRPELLAIFPDFSISGARVGATNALSVKYLAGKDAFRLGLFGSGKLARTCLTATCAVRKIREVRVYSPTPEHRNSFAAEMSKVVDLEIVPVAEPRQAVENSDIIICVTDSMTPVFKGEWLPQGCHVVNTLGGDKFHMELYGGWSSEVDEATIRRSDVRVVHMKDLVVSDRQGAMFSLVEKGELSLDQLVELKDVVAGKETGRTSERQITLFDNNCGVGIQFAATAALVYEEAKKKGLGRELPKEWFVVDVSDWARKGFYPSP